MTQEISSLMDGELGAQEAGRALRACCADEDQKRTWYLYHAIGDAMRGQPPRALAMPADVFEKLKQQPTVLAPRRRRPRGAVSRAWRSPPPPRWRRWAWWDGSAPRAAQGPRRCPWSPRRRHVVDPARGEHHHGAARGRRRSRAGVPRRASPDAVARALSPGDQPRPGAAAR